MSSHRILKVGSESQRAGWAWANILQPTTQVAHMPQTVAAQSEKLLRNLFVEILQGKTYDTPNLKIGLSMVAVTLLAKFTMMYGESHGEEHTTRSLAESQGLDS